MIWKNPWENDLTSGAPGISWDLGGTDPESWSIPGIPMAIEFIDLHLVMASSSHTEPPIYR